jgi:hypothetical protein
MVGFSWTQPWCPISWPAARIILVGSGNATAEWPGMKNVLLMPNRSRRSKIRRKAIGPNSPREIMLGDFAPSVPIQTQQAVKVESQSDPYIFYLGSHNGVSSLPIKHNSAGARAVMRSNRRLRRRRKVP